MFRLIRFLFKSFFTIVGFIVSLSLLCITYYYFKSDHKPQSLHAHMVVELDLNTPLTEGPSHTALDTLLSKQSHNFLDVLLAIKQASHDKRVHGLLIRGDSHHLGIAQIQELREAFVSFKQQGKKIWFFTDSFGEMNQSYLLYYIASACDEIYIQPTGYLNLSGLNLDLPYLGKLMKKLGIKAQIATREDYKTAMSFLTNDEISAAEVESYQTIINGIFEQFVEDVAKDREITANDFIATMMQDPLMPAIKALQANLVDKLIYWDDIKDLIKKLFKEELHFINISQYYYHPSQDNNDAKNDDQIAIIYATGSITRERPTYEPLRQEGSVMVSYYIEKAVDEILENPKIKAVVLRIDSGGGSAVASDTIFNHIQRLKRKKIPVIVSMGNAAASGGYWIACYADQIIADPLTLTGSIGVYAGKINYNEFLEKLGIHFDKVAVGPHGQIWSELHPYSEQEWNYLEKHVTYIYELFLNHVVIGRNLPKEHIKQVAKGRVWLGKQAKEYGLVDQLGGILKAIDVAKDIAHLPKDKSPQLLIYPKPKSTLELMQSFVSGEANIKISLHHFIGALITDTLKSANKIEVQAAAAGI